MKLIHSCPVAVVGCVLGLVFLAASREIDAENAALAGRSDPPREASASLEVALATRAPARAEPEPAEAAGRTDPARPSAASFASHRDAESYLAEYWGERWPAVRTELLAEGIDLATIDLGKLRDWPEARQMFLRDLASQLDAGIEVVESEFLTWGADLQPLQPVRFGGPARALDASERAELELRLAPYHDELRRLAADYHGAAVVMALEALEGDLVERHPIFYPAKTLGAASIRVREMVLVQELAGHGWVVSFQIRKTDAPEFQLWLEEAERVRAERQRVTGEYLRALG